MDSETKSIRDRIQAQLESLPAERVAEVGNFVDFIAQREDEKARAIDHALAGATSALNTIAFERVWDNSEDAAYDHL